MERFPMEKDVKARVWATIIILRQFGLTDLMGAARAKRKPTQRLVQALVRHGYLVQTVKPGTGRTASYRLAVAHPPVVLPELCRATKAATAAGGQSAVASSAKLAPAQTGNAAPFGMRRVYCGWVEWAGRRWTSPELCAFEGERVLVGLTLPDVLLVANPANDETLCLAKPVGTPLLPEGGPAPQVETKAAPPGLLAISREALRKIDRAASERRLDEAVVRMARQ